MSEQFFKTSHATAVKTLPKLGLVFGWANVSKVHDGRQFQKYYDRGYIGPDGRHRRDHVTEEAILKSSLRYMLGQRVAGEMHKSAAAVELEKALDGISDPDTRAAAAEIIKQGQRRNSPPPLLDIAGAETTDILKGNVQKRGVVPFAFPLLEDMLDPLGIQTTKTGLLVGMKPDPAMFARFESGELTSFSIGGRRLEDVVVGGDE